MIEFRAVELKKGDEFTVDNGETWWKVVSVEKPVWPGTVELRTCQMDKAGADLWRYFTIKPDVKVIVR